jgi:hypothetical protein
LPYSTFAAICSAVAGTVASFAASVRNVLPKTSSLQIRFCPVASAKSLSIVLHHHVPLLSGWNLQLLIQTFVELIYKPNSFRGVDSVSSPRPLFPPLTFIAGLKSFSVNEETFTLVTAGIP